MKPIPDNKHHLLRRKTHLIYEIDSILGEQKEKLFSAFPWAHYVWAVSSPVKSCEEIN